MGESEDQGLYTGLYISNQKVRAFVKQWFLPPVYNRCGSPPEVALEIALSLCPGIDILYGMTQMHLLIPEIKVSLNRMYFISDVLWFSFSFLNISCKKKMLVCNSKLISLHGSLGQV